MDWLRLSRRELFGAAGGLVASSILARPRPALGGILDRLFHGQSGKPRAPITPNDEFYVTSYRSPPTVRIEDWSLSVTGLVERPVALNYNQLLARPAITEIVTLECIGNTVAGEFIGTAAWKGISLKTLLEDCGADPRSVDVVFRAMDDYSDSIRFTRAMVGDVLVAHTMNGMPLPLGHGFPARMIVPGLYGMKSVQWLREIEVVDRDYQGYYQKKGWTDDATVKTASWIDVPVHGVTLRGGQHPVYGAAYAGIRGIQRAELSFDEGQTWQSTMLEPPLARAAWVFWRYDWEVRARGYHSMLVRATDGEGCVQSSEEQGPSPDGTTGLHHIAVKVEV